MRSATAAVVMSVLLTVSGAGLAEDEAKEKNPDPWEGFNRKVQGFNDWADRWFLRPVAVGYTKVVPSPVRTGVSNFYANLWLPLTIVNQLLQGKGGAALNDTGRFILNSTIGIGGLLDPATDAGLERHDEDFGQTFGRWGIPSGPYLVLPLLGPSTVRNGIGRVPDSYLFPPRYIDDTAWRYGVYGLYVIEARARLLSTEELITGDRYIFIRDAYLQNREYNVKDGNVDVEDDPFLEDDWEE